jgi:CDGSH-type Zn-finger protein
MCLCKQTKNPPYCDGSHARIPEGITEMDSPG